ncbi:two-component system sensor histidine kinase NtrB [Pacificimonas sp. ICDLI1SI03]
MPLRFRRRAVPLPAELLNALQIPIILVDRSGHPIQANPAAEMLFSRSEDALATKGWAGLLPADSPVRALLHEASTHLNGISAYDVSIALIDAPSFVADVLISPVTGESNHMTLAFQRRSVAALVERQSDNRGAARSAAALAAMLAHEIKNPLSGIRGAAQLLGGEDRDELSDLIISEVDRISALIGRMERFTDPRPPILGRENIHSILSHVRKLAQADGIQIAESYDPSLPPVAADRDALVQLFLNLVKNAQEAAGKGGTVTLTTAYRHGLKIGVPGGRGRVKVPIEVCVIDNGPGAPADIVEDMFDAFVSSKRGLGGLGLALVAKIASDHQGHVEYERDEREGRTIMRVLLPMAPPS